MIGKRRAVQASPSARVCLIRVNINRLAINCYFNSAPASNFLWFFFVFFCIYVCQFDLEVIHVFTSITHCGTRILSIHRLDGT